MKRWYVAQVYAGYEDVIKADIIHKIELEGVQELFGEVLVPSAEVKPLFEVATAKKNEQQLFPGYLLVEMEVTPEAIRLVTSVPRVVRFLGGLEPVALSKKEIERIISQIKGEVAVVQAKSDFVVGSEVEIAEGPFAGFVGIVDSLEEDNERMTIMVSIFGRMTPVELRFDQVKR